MAMRFRKEPFSIHFRWLEGSANEGRKVIFVRGKYDNNLQVLTGQGDPLPGIRTAIDPKSAQTMSASRRTIEEAGMGNMIERFGFIIAAIEAGSNAHGTLEYRGQQQRPEFRDPVECAVQHIPAGKENDLPEGGERFWYFNADANAKEFGLPVLVIAKDKQGREIEYYCHEGIELNVGLGEKDFDAEVVLGRR